MRWLRYLRQRLHCITYAGTCPFCEAWKQSSRMPEHRDPMDVPGRKYPEKSPDASAGRQASSSAASN